MNYGLAIWATAHKPRIWKTILLYFQQRAFFNINALFLLKGIFQSNINFSMHDQVHVFFNCG